MILDVSTMTIYTWFRSDRLDNVKTLALAQLGCEQAQAEARQFLPYRRAASRK